jgi:hypothetical protein
MAIRTVRFKTIRVFDSDIRKCAYQAGMRMLESKD